MFNTEKLTGNSGQVPLSLSSLPRTGVAGRTHLVEEGLEDTVPHSPGELLYLDTDTRELSAGLENVRLSGDERLGPTCTWRTPRWLPGG